MWKTFLASCPKLELVTNVPAPGVRESPAQDTYDDVDVFTLIDLAESAYNSGLDKSMD
jgi:hypothetical protein